MAERLRIFISSPSDVDAERLRAHLVIGRLARDYARFFSIQACLWEHEPMLATGHFQDAIEPPAAFDIVVVILYARLGTPLPEKTALRSYQGLDGRVPVTGTEWEFEDALSAHRQHGAPDLLAYRKTGDPGTSLANRELRKEQERQWQLLESFWARHFENGGLFLAGSARFSTLEEFDARLENDLTALIERRIKHGGAVETDAVWLKGSPFRGLETYEFADADIFFGRDGETREALARWHSAAAGGTAFLVVLGASGAGKSSLARAGLLPGLVAPGAVTAVGLWRRVILRPGHGGEDPVVALAAALVAGQGTGGEGLPELLGPDISIAALAQHLASAADDPSFPFRLALNQVAERARAAGRMLAHEQARLVVLADQFEELFGSGIAPERRALFVRILAGLARSGLVYVIATIRNDFWHHAAEVPEFLGLVESGARFDLARPDAAAMIEIVRRPAAVAGLEYEIDPQTGLRLDAVIAAAASHEIGALPLLSVLLDTLYQRDVQAAGGTRLLTFASYRALGELRGAIAQRAESVLERLGDRDPEAARTFPMLLRRLIGITESIAVARPLPLGGIETGSPQARLVDSFLQPDARLLVINASPSGPDVRLAHEALIRNWPRAAAQIAQDQNDYVLRGRLEAQMAGWREAKSADKGRALLTGLSLAEGADLAERWGAALDEGLAGFIKVSRRAATRRRMLAGLAGGVPALILGGYGVSTALDYYESLSLTRIRFADIAVPGPDYAIAAGPYLRRFGIAITARHPENSDVLIVSNLGLYQGEAVDPVSGQHFLTQRANPATAPLAFTLSFDHPVREVRIQRAQLWAATKSGVTHPAWTITALDSTGKTIAVAHEALLGSYKTIPAKWYALRALAGQTIAALRIESDFRDAAGKPFAGFQAVLIQELELVLK